MTKTTFTMRVTVEHDDVPVDDLADMLATELGGRSLLRPTEPGEAGAVVDDVSDVELAFDYA